MNFNFSSLREIKKIFEQLSGFVESYGIVWLEILIQFKKKL